MREGDGDRERERERETETEREREREQESESERARARERERESEREEREGERERLLVSAGKTAYRLREASQCFTGEPGLSPRRAPVGGCPLALGCVNSLRSPRQCPFLRKGREMV
ncbi:hypothetical protein chiPu_0024430 [Chiloscyllium punctatum]|uniref:Uncharacterized protein n=1 Tax=Chiloscyllium punctatum TaxID=137246 RepID=A0A401TC54_CHIPU|nr:hypothetical protein [Chiloscyllium punctatum]